ncbi:prephenate dehydrogenase [Actinomadura sediminis]|uniref:Prephenate dehydrogenase n=1 Tax=Actinomadura sediminis TaxID=1038904 RepID=A0ABW3F0I8_9ACTN
MSPRRVTVIGTGLVGTSVALALRRAGVRVALADRDPDAVAGAARMGAGGRLAADTPRADVVVIATPPSAVAGVLREAQRRGLGAAYTDVAGVKAPLLADAARAGCDLAAYVPGHPMAGRELSGPAGAAADLFRGRPWALCPHPRLAPGPLNAAVGLAALCGADPVLVASADHDRTAAAVSHVPHLLSSALAARFADADDASDPELLALAGRGLRDMTRIAAGAPALWHDILRRNAGEVSAVLDAVVRDLAEVAAALREDDPGGDRLLDLLARGAQGRARIVKVPSGRAVPPRTGPTR